MKSSLITLTLIMILVNSVKADPITTDSLGKLIVQGNSQIVRAIEKHAKDSTEISKSNAKAGNNTVVPLKQNVLASNLISILPVIFFLMIIVVVFRKLKRDGVKLSDFLVDKDLQATIRKEEVKTEVANAAAETAVANAVAANAPAFQAAGVAPNIPKVPAAEPNDKAADSQQSVSRLVAFISGVTSVAIAVCITTFYFYRWSLGDTGVDISNLSSILYGLGLGVIPYGFNKIAGALKS